MEIAQQDRVGVDATVTVTVEKLPDMMIEDVWHQGYSIHLSSFYGWSPETWGMISYSDAGRRETILRETTDPFIAVIYVTKSAPEGADPTERGMIAGFYLVSHEQGHRDAFTAPSQHSLEPGKWEHGLRALRALRFLPEYRLSIDEFDPSVARKGQAVARFGMEVAPQAAVALMGIPYIEEPIFGGSELVSPVIHLPHHEAGQDRASGSPEDDIAALSGRVGPGAINRSGYSVPAEPPDAPKELYILRLQGDTTAWLSNPIAGRAIYKIGYSMSPQTRCDAFQRALPWGRFHWTVDRSTCTDGDPRIEGAERAILGENAMKDFLAEHAEWLGGEFYAATDDQIARAWQIGRRAANQ